MTDCVGTRESNWKVYIIMFVVYSVLGSIAEHLFYWIGSRFGNPLSSKTNLAKGRIDHKYKTITNPIMDGFPLYGVTAYVFILIKRLIDLYVCKSGNRVSILVEFFIFALAAVIIEYTSGILVGAGPNSRNENGYVKTWDFSMNHFNYKGIVDVWHTILYAAMGLVVVRVHPILLRFFTIN